MASAYESLKDAATITTDWFSLAKNIIATLNGSRSVVCTIVNATPGHLLLEASDHAHGGFSTAAPAAVDPHSPGLFGSQSKSWSIGTGTEGWVRYTYRLQGYEAVSLTFGWDDPFVGDNSSSTSRSAVHPRLVVINEAGAGNEKADIRFSIIDLGIDLYGVIRDKWEQLGAQNSALGWPSTSEADLAGIPGARFNLFDHGAIHYRNGKAFEIHGAIFGHLAASALTHAWFAATDETIAPDGEGRYNHFFDWTSGDPGDTPNSSIYWHPQTGAFLVAGEFRSQWAAQGWENGQLGYPTSDPTMTVYGLVQQFQGGQLGGSSTMATPMQITLPANVLANQGITP